MNRYDEPDLREGFTKIGVQEGTAKVTVKKKEDGEIYPLYFIESDDFIIIIRGLVGSFKIVEKNHEQK